MPTVGDAFEFVLAEVHERETRTGDRILDRLGHTHLRRTGSEAPGRSAVTAVPRLVSYPTLRSSIPESPTEARCAAFHGQPRVSHQFEEPRHFMLIKGASVSIGVGGSRDLTARRWRQNGGNRTSRARRASVSPQVACVREDGRADEGDGLENR